MTDDDKEVFVMERVTNRQVYDKLLSLEKLMGDHLAKSDKNTAKHWLHLKGLWAVVTFIGGVLVAVVLR